MALKSSTVSNLVSAIRTALETLGSWVSSTLLLISAVRLLDAGKFPPL